MYYAILLIAGLAAVPGAPEQAGAQDHALAYGCDDIVVVGRLKNGGWGHVEIADDLLGHGWASATLKVRKRVYGAPGASVIPVRYFEHAYLREDRDFLFVLTKADGGTYEVVGKKLMSARPRLAMSCT
ncbi:hypothetical protein J2W22_002569 [Sphingomonas kyeonggiensis]|uniref:hypothetical protein n=1 Tax=Sphingomonas kyeonggiensis TaxID=1268553 RepID=UPI002788E931|nr:hypothetical protein [Sphingomonas kyeonggiensis]MDQ0250505.1 hypothetical protein [Sphingomonas kyeonggiensis]